MVERSVRVVPGSCRGTDAFPRGAAAVTGEPGAAPFIVCAAIGRDGAVLLMRRAVDPFLGYPCHELPGGPVGPGEPPPVALVRIVRAVTGLDGTVGDLLGGDDRGLVYAVTVAADAPVQLRNHIGYQWAPLSGELDIPERVRRFLRPGA